MARRLLLLVLLALLAARDGRTDESLRLYAEAAHDSPLASAQASLRLARSSPSPHPRLEASFQAPSASRRFAGRGAPWGRRVVAAFVGGGNRESNLLALRSSRMLPIHRCLLLNRRPTRSHRRDELPIYRRLLLNRRPARSHRRDELPIQHRLLLNRRPARSHQRDEVTRVAPSSSNLHPWQVIHPALLLCSKSIQFFLVPCNSLEICVLRIQSNPYPRPELMCRGCLQVRLPSLPLDECPVLLLSICFSVAASGHQGREMD
ncbi:non-green plastid inner envelope membrane protein [Panicum miliaceum]|uniref:Non-green plastid inner envelope membrane protein n=1 Tax=Panicum miliaceum TaxID=4540 RepID=A0A3L6PJ76_PANMI|nr:non-green plastid inner envelope membrane protein [Panicum miliaceum]